MGNYYLILSNGSLEIVNDFLYICENNDDLLVYSKSGQLSFKKQDVVIYGNGEFWKNIMELFNCIERLIKRQVKDSVTKAIFLGYLMGRIT
ncbi:hypothetical protein BBF96_14625 [Anoxybacter fermentans]|uniref:Uncharacterized protein n=1 Tax=Anoxybacter fermentans TaxID=1323375 RepID=A0A3S9T236_9FIRM|nr:hypothetical protein [Anoxybacter fermentans]AZR74512.1 hypothetical protein BBF96_14625 [Anoxybacter fermentans]